MDSDNSLPPNAEILQLAAASESVATFAAGYLRRMAEVHRTLDLEAIELLIELNQARLEQAEGRLPRLRSRACRVVDLARWTFR